MTWTSTVSRTLASLAFSATAASAADPECIDAMTADPAQPYNATSGIRLCTPLLDESGQPLAPGELERCTVLANGAPYVTLATTVPGSYFVVPPPTTGDKRGSLSAYCEGQAGAGEPTAVYDALWRRAKPGKPLVTP